MPRQTKESFVDIIPSSGKRVISDVVIAPKQEITSQFFKEPPPTIKPPKRYPGAARKGRFIFAILALLALAIALSAVFGKVEVTVIPKALSIQMDKTLPLSKSEAGLPDGKADGFLIFRTLTLPHGENGLFNATGKKLQDQKAQGIVAVFNKSKTPQVLIASTRLEAPDGKVYRIPKTIVVSGAKTQGGKTTPGVLDVTVVADKPGVEYNLGLSDFTLPGLKGSPKYELVFARSKTEISGGASGEQIIVGKSDADAALTALMLRARAAAPELISRRIPKEEFLITESVEYVTTKESSVPPPGSPAEKFDFSAEGEIRGASVEMRALEEALLKDLPELAALGGAAARIKNLDKLPMKLIGYKFGARSFTLAVRGTVEIEAVVDAETLKSAVLEFGARGAISRISSLPSISGAEVRFKPFWWRKTPSDPSRIDIVLKGS
ncbi:hypothetical protein A2661_02880 [Candidatus Giovannonibacteria bacterium RIFCSPHIGHO2_01_FULL_45_24]|uniref:Baseplate protein J-like domain-containing protein n=1 Tax=Candidatus Giovannonibacteria bacterium RIFCSPLOWO2_01_FULL_46_32 TaxID=1798353 RepID=A0A1F5XGG1_9BACT|nr:MAG: hypothetical protein A2661_02880 [Candidatus Giovannonibacteria bacterium RIFCSPHIGHO2_01_FULL_45_24]OGF86957.1 MAG: hypothetical protein A3B19_00800 [Candidatus Giovannonibacteria bacterium RIFCSPLOWO2_01_FULL_46_32]